MPARHLPAGKAAAPAPPRRARLLSWLAPRPRPAGPTPDDASDEGWPDLLNPDCTLPADEHVRLRSIWVAEVFPPSRIARLAAGLKRMGWDEQRFEPLSPSDDLRQARSGRWPIWSRRLGRLLPPTAPSFLFELGAVAAELPEGIQAVHATVSQPLPSVCLLLVEFELDARAAGELEALFPRQALPEEPSHLRRVPARALERALRPRVEALRARRRERCTEWLAARVPGLFADAGRFATAELVTLEHAVPFDRSLSWCPGYLSALGLPPLFAASGMAGGSLRMGPLFGIRGDVENLVLAGRDWELAEEIDPNDPGYPPDTCVERVRAVVQEPLVQWTLWLLARRYAEELAALRDAVAAAAGQGRAGSRSFAQAQLRFLALLNDAIPFASELQALTADARRYEERLPLFHFTEPRLAGLPKETFQLLRERTHEQAAELARLVAEVREVTTTTGSVMATLSHDRMGRINVGLQVAVGVLSLVTVAQALLAIFG